MNDATVESDVNVGGPDGDPPACSVGTVLVPYNGDTSRKWLWDELDAVRRKYAVTWGGLYPMERCASAQYSTQHEGTEHCFCWGNCEQPCCWCGDDSEGEGEQAICPGVSS